MTTFLIILAIVASIVLGFFILIQKPKGGGLSGSFGSLGTQVMGVKQSGDVMEKGTWYAVTALAVLAIAITFSLEVPKPQAAPPAEQQQQQPAQQQAPAPPAAQ